MNKSTNYNFNLPNSANDEVADINDISDNFVTIDSTMKTIENTVETADTAIKALQSGKVDKVSGKGLSSNDYTDTEKEKLQGIEAGATKNIIDQTFSETSQNAQSGIAISGKLQGKQDFFGNLAEVEDERLVELNTPSGKVAGGIAITQNGVSVTNMRSPTSVTDSANKEYVDTQVSDTKIWAKQSFSNALTAEVSGKILRIDDMTPLEMNLDVWVTSTESGILAVAGKNLVNINASAELSNSTEIANNGVRFDASGGCADIYLNVPAGKYTLSFERSATGIVYVRNGKVDSGYIAQVSGESKVFTVNNLVDGFIRLQSYTAGLEITNIQIEVGANATSYENGGYELYESQGSSKINEVPRRYPTTTMWEQGSGMTVNCKYNRDINKAFEQLQQAIINSGGAV